MSTLPALCLSHEWLDAPGVAVASHAQTWARWEVSVGDVVLTSLVDLRTRSLRDGVYGPLMPVAEWLVSNWWFLWEETLPGHRGPERVGPLRWDYTQPTTQAWLGRHGMRAAEEGDVLPDLRIHREGDDVLGVQMVCDPTPGRGPFRTGRPVCFTREGYWLVDRRETRQHLTQWIDGVVERLEGCDDADATALRAYWTSLRHGTPDAIRLQQYAARLGLDGNDPEAVDDDLARVLLQGGLPSVLMGDLLDLPGLRPAQVADSLAQATRLRDAGRTRSGGNGRLRRIREALSPALALQPWRDGWQMAHQLREMSFAGELRVGARLDATIAEQAWLDIAPVPWLGTSPRGLYGWVDAFADDTAPAALWQTANAADLRFRRAQLLGVALQGRRERLVTIAYDRVQTIGRHFAAELIAPAEWLRARLPAEAPEDPEGLVQALASELGAPPRVLWHQIANHELASWAE